MYINNDIKKHNCDYCNYLTNRKFDLKKHHMRKHNNELYKYNDENILCEMVHPKSENVIPKSENVIPKSENVIPKSENVIPKSENVIPNNYICKKCNKIYKTKIYLIEHEKKCKGVDDLTCSRCMISFSNRQNKYRHIKRNNCKPRSIIHARTPNKHNIENIQNVEQLTNNIETQINNNIGNQNNNNFIINNYGCERLDYLNYEKMLEIFKKSYNIPTLLTKEIHFNEEFPENNNIKYNNDKSALLKKDDKFIYKNLTVLAQELINNKGELIQKFALENKDDICLKMGLELYEKIIENLIDLLLLHKPDENYIKQVENIRDLIKNTKVENIEI
jgi:hypothetical protein